MTPVDAVNRWNAQHPWSHNDHFHGWILRNLPARRTAALDVGCGRGGLVELLAHRFESVTGVDPDAEMAALSRERLRTRPSVEIRQEFFLDTTGSYDLITMVASLHHQPLGLALRHAAELLAPGGRLLVVGLAQHGPVPGTSVPVRDPEETFPELRAAAEALLPGARVRRRLWFRHTISWEK